MDAVKLGPVLISMQPLILLAGLSITYGVAACFRNRRGIDPGPVLLKMVMTGFVIARLTFVWRHHNAYLVAPLSIIDIRDGGFDDLAGYAGALIAGTELTWRSMVLRQAVLTASLVGCTFFYTSMALDEVLSSTNASLPYLELWRLDGSPLALNSLAGRPLVINLWATWCPPCLREMPAMSAARLAHPEVEFVFANQGETVASIERYLATHGLSTVGVVSDPTSQLSARTASSGYPTTLFYDARGRLSARHMGELSSGTLDERLDALVGAGQSQ